MQGRVGGDGRGSRVGYIEIVEYHMLYGNGIDPFMVAGFRAAGVENTEPALVVLVVVQVVHKVVFNSESAAADISGCVAKP